MIRRKKRKLRKKGYYTKRALQRLHLIKMKTKPSYRAAYENMVKAGLVRLPVVKSLKKMEDY